MPTMGAVTFAIVHASAICAIFASFFFASSSTLFSAPVSISDATARQAHAPVDDLDVRLALVLADESAWVRVRSRACVEKGVAGAYRSTSPRLEDALTGRVSRPRARGDHGIEPTPNIFSDGNISRSSSR